MTRRRIRALAVLLVVTAILTGCSPAHHGGVRLHANGTVDFALCDFPVRSIYVDYYVDGQRDPVESWSAHRSGDGRYDPIAFEYGVVPPGFTNDFPLKRPPRDWTVVSTPAGGFHREDLLEGEWVWNTPTWPFPWIPAQPCGGISVDPDGDLRVGS